MEKIDSFRLKIKTYLYLLKNTDPYVPENIYYSSLKYEKEKYQARKNRKFTFPKN